MSYARLVIAAKANKFHILQFHIVSVYFSLIWQFKEEQVGLLHTMTLGIKFLSIWWLFHFWEPPWNLLLYPIHLTDLSVKKKNMEDHIGNWMAQPSVSSITSAHNSLAKTQTSGLILTAKEYGKDGLLDYSERTSSWFLTHSALISFLKMRIIIIIPTSPGSCEDQNVRSCFIIEEVERAVHIWSIMASSTREITWDNRHFTSSFWGPHG